MKKLCNLFTFFSMNNNEGTSMSEPRQNLGNFYIGNIYGLSNGLVTCQRSFETVAS